MKPNRSTARRASTLLALAAVFASVSCRSQQSSPADLMNDAQPASVIPAQTLPEDRGGNGLWQDLKRLRTWASMMMIVAHPDDEDGGMLTYESRGQGVRTSLMTLTRGEGGQNVVSSDADDALGLIRTNELLAADQYYGVDQYWARVADYGFSKTIEEAFQQWGHDRVLYDTVRAVRRNRPLVITASFIGGITDGHGQHQVSGEMAQEVFTAAGDPAVFPDQIKAGLRPWFPLKVYARVPSYSIGKEGMFDYATGKWAPIRFYNYVTKQWSTETPATNVVVEEGTYDPLLGRTYAQIARQGWGFQKTQNGGGYVVLPGEVNSEYHRYGTRVKSGENESGFFDGIDTSLAGIATLAHGDTGFLKTGLQGIDAQLAKAMAAYSPAVPEKTAPALHDGYLATAALIAKVKASSLSADDQADVTSELDRKLAQFNAALVDALGLKITAIAAPKAGGGNKGFGLALAAEDTRAAVTPGAEVYVRIHVLDPASTKQPAAARLIKTSVFSEAGAVANVERLPDSRSAGDARDALFRISIAPDAAGTRPYFSRPGTEQAYYNIDDPRWLNDSFAPYPLTGSADFDYNGVPIEVRQTVQTVHRVEGIGSVENPLVIAPGISVGIQPGAGAVPLGQTEFSLTARVHSNLDGIADGNVRLALPTGWTSEPAQGAFRLKAGEEQGVSFRVHPDKLESKSYEIKAIAQSEGKDYSDGYRTVGYPGLRPYNYYRPATYRARGVDVKVAPGLNLGYVMGSGDEIPQALEDLGVPPHLISSQELSSGDLSKYNVIVLGIRAYAARPELTASNGRLLDYVRNGGALVVQYQSGEYDHNFGPFPYTLGKSPEKVVDESAPVAILDPKAPLMSWPNQITSTDFDGWVEERGHSFMESWDPKYVPLTETHDPGQDPQKGGLLYARDGKGIYIYLAYALYRQTPAAVPGAYRLLANLVSAGAPH